MAIFPVLLLPIYGVSTPYAHVGCILSFASLPVMINKRKTIRRDRESGLRKIRCSFILQSTICLKYAPKSLGAQIESYLSASLGKQPRFESVRDGRLNILP